MRFITSTLSIGLLFACCSAFAASNDYYAASNNKFASSSDEHDDKSIPVGGANLTPLINIIQRYDNNILSAKSDEINTWITIIQPSFKLVREFGEFGLNNWEIDYILSNGKYYSSHDDDFTDHDISGTLNYEINQRHRLKFQGGYINSHEDRGARFSIGTGSELKEPDNHEQIYSGLRYTLGAETADARLELEFGYLDDDYNTVMATDSSTGELYDLTASRDRITHKLGAKFFYKIASATDLTLEAWHSDIDYDETLGNDPDLSSIEQQFMAGLEWEATALTTGYAKIGYKEKDFEEARSPFESFEWEVEVDWEPLTYSKFTFATARVTEETNGEGFFFLETVGEGIFIESTSYKISWRHEWLERLNTKLTFGLTKDDYNGKNEIVRKDDNKGVRLAINYDMTYWLTFSLDFSKTKRESTRDFLTYDREVAALGVRIALF